MTRQHITAALIGSITAFLLGWLIWGVLTMDYYQSNIRTEYSALANSEPDLLLIYCSQLLWSALSVFVIQRGKTQNFISGFRTGAIVYFLIEAGFNAMQQASMELYSGFTFVVVNILLNTIFGGLVGGVIGLWLGRKAAP